MIYILMVVLIFSCDYNQEEQARAELELFILEEEVILNDNRVELSLKVVNNTDTTFLFPAFGMIQESVVKETYYQTGLNFASGTALLVTKNNGDLVYFEEPEIGHVDFEDVRNLLEETDKAYIDDMVRLSGDTSVSINISKELRYYLPEKGEYDLFFIHYSGVNLENFVSEVEQDSLENFYQAQIFQGWIKSNTVKLIVN